MQCAPEATKFGEITQNKRHYAAFKVTNFCYQSEAHLLSCAVSGI